MKAEPKKVIVEIIELRTKAGYSSTSLVQHLKDKYDINTTRAYELIKEAREIMGKVYDEINVDAIKDSVLFMENLRQKVLGAGNDKLALEIQKELNRVQQLYIQKMELTSNQPIIINIKTDKKNEGDE